MDCWPHVKSGAASNGQKIAETSTEQLEALQEGLGAIRDVLLAGNQNMYLNTYQKSDRLLRYLRVRNNFIGLFLALHSRLWDCFRLLCLALFWFLNAEVDLR